MILRKNILTIGTFDCTGGLGILADVKTFEQFKIQGFTIPTGYWFQRENTIETIDFINPDFIFQQLEQLLLQFNFEYIKIGLVQNFEILEKIITLINSKQIEAKIIWNFTQNQDLNYQKELLEYCLSKTHIFIINENNLESFFQSNSKDVQYIIKYCNLYIKSKTDLEKDFLYWEDKKYPFKQKGKRKTMKNGLEDIFTAALCANLSKGYPILKSCLRAKTYLARVMESTTNELGFHKF